MRDPDFVAPRARTASPRYPAGGPAGYPPPRAAAARRPSEAHRRREPEWDMSDERYDSDAVGQRYAARASAGRYEAEASGGRYANGASQRRYNSDEDRGYRVASARQRDDIWDDDTTGTWRDRLAGFLSLETWRRIGDSLFGMADADSTSGRRSGRGAGLTQRQRLVNIAFWIGVGIGPIAALLLLLGQGVTPLRAAAVLAVMAVVLIGLSVTFRDDPAAVRRELEEEFRREVESVRADVATLRRGVQLTVNRELDRVRGEIEQARTVIHTEATRLPVAAQNGHQPVQPPRAPAANPPAAPVERYAPRQPASSPVEARTAEYRPPARYDEYDVHTVEPIRERYTGGNGYGRDNARDAYGAAESIEPISGDVLTPAYGGRDSALRWQLGREQNGGRAARRRHEYAEEEEYAVEYGGSGYSGRRGGGRHSGR